MAADDTGRGQIASAVEPQTITKRHLIDEIAARTKHKKAAVRDVVQEFLGLVVEELGAGRRLEFRDFGVFEVNERAARVAQNPKTMERVMVPPKMTVKFKPGRKMKEAVDGLDATQNGALLDLSDREASDLIAAGPSSVDDPSRGGDADGERTPEIEVRIGSSAAEKP